MVCDLLLEFMRFLTVKMLMRLSHHSDSTTDATPVAGSPLIVKADSQVSGTFLIPDPTVSGNPSTFSNGRYSV